MDHQNILNTEDQLEVDMSRRLNKMSDYHKQKPKAFTVAKLSNWKESKTDGKGSTRLNESIANSDDLQE